MKILVTGGAGFIGSHVVEHYQQSASEIVVLDNFRTGHRKNLDTLRCTLVEGSIEDRMTVRALLEGVDYVFHLAAMVSVPESMTKVVECVRVNTCGTIILLEEAAKAGVKKVVMASSAAVYGDNPTVPKVESMLPEPRSPYAITKLDGEYYCDLFNLERGVATAALRFFNVFGPRQDPKGQYAAAVPIFMEKALRNETIRIFGDGSQTRDFIFVKDIVGALGFVAESPSVCGVFNVGYGQQMTINELAQKIIRAARSSSLIEYAPERIGDVKHSRACPDKILNAGWSPRHSLDEALSETLAHFASA